MEYHRPDRHVRQAMLLARAGLFNFTTNPPYRNGHDDANVIGFWVRGARGQVREVPGSAWYRLSWRSGVGGGRIAIGIDNVQDDAEMMGIATTMPDLISGVLAGAPADVAWTVGRLGFGRYVADDRTTFDDRSAVIQVSGIGGQGLERLGLKLARLLDQTSVLVFDDGSSEVFTIGPTKPRRIER